MPTSCKQCEVKLSIGPAWHLMTWNDQQLHVKMWHVEIIEGHQKNIQYPEWYKNASEMGLWSGKGDEVP